MRGQLWAPETPRTSRLYGTEDSKRGPPINRPQQRGTSPPHNRIQKSQFASNFLLDFLPLKKICEVFFPQNLFLQEFPQNLFLQDFLQNLFLKDYFMHKNLLNCDNFFFTQNLLLMRETFSHKIVREFSVALFTPSFSHKKFREKKSRLLRLTVLLSDGRRLIIEQQLKVNQTKPIGFDRLDVLGPGGAHHAEEEEIHLFNP